MLLGVPDFDLRRDMRNAHRALLSAAVMSAVGHRGAVGQARERLIADLLNRHLPRSLVADHGAEIVTATARSGACDIVIRKAETPPLLNYQTHMILRSDSVEGVVEVKSKLSASTLMSAYDLLYSARAISDDVRGSAPGGWVVAFDGPKDARPLRDRLAGRHQTHPPRQWLDGVWMLGPKQAIVWAGANNVPQPRPAGGIGMRVLKSDDLLLMMLWLIVERLAPSSGRSLRDFAPNLTWDFID